MTLRHPANGGLGEAGLRLQDTGQAVVHPGVAFAVEVEQGLVIREKELEQNLESLKQEIKNKLLPK